MPAPSAYPDIDTNGTNTMAIVSGHATDGFANNEIPTSREFNQILMLIGLWIRWLASYVLGGWIWYSPFCASYNGSSTVPPVVGTFSSVRKNYAQLSSTTFADPSAAIYPAAVAVGLTITDVGAYIDGNGATTPVFSIFAFKVDASGTETSLGGVVNATPTSGIALYSHALTAPYTVAAGDSIYIYVNGSVGGGVVKVYQAGVKAGLQ